MTTEPAFFFETSPPGRLQLRILQLTTSAACGLSTFKKRPLTHPGGHIELNAAGRAYHSIHHHPGEHGWS
jgi:hypothetical protein